MSTTIKRAQPGYVYGAGADLEVLACGECGMVFAAPARWVRERRDDHKTFWCPNGHGRVFKGESEAEKLKRQLRYAQDIAAARLAERDQAQASLRATRGVVTRYRNRLQDGQCPVCGKHLAHLERHMARVHPDGAPDEATGA